ncbi:hypothetical protein OSR40_016360 [Serratia rubidaea]|nr:hypothetical protein [Serratia rubidaea]
MAKKGGEANISPPSLNLLEPSALTDISTVIEKDSNVITNEIPHSTPASSGSTPVTVALLTVACSTTAAFIYNKLHWWSVTSRESRIKTAESIIDILLVLEEISVDYWIKNYSKKNADDNTKCEIKIKSCLNLINTLIPSLVSKIPRRKRGYYKKLFRDYHEDLFDLITGDDFESSSRKSNLIKADKISNRCLKFRVGLVNLSV